MTISQRSRRAALSGPRMIALAIGLAVPFHADADRARPAEVAPLHLSYLFKPGETRRYQVTALFDGHIPPFAQPGSKPIHLLIKFEYVAKVLKQDPKGTQISFTVDTADMNLLTDEVAMDAKIDPDSETPFPIALADVQKTLDATATLRPDGSLSDIAEAGPNIVRVNVGFDLRKLFLMVMPVIFKSAPARVGDTWPQQEGVIGTKPGSIAYTNRLISAQRSGQGLLMKIEQKGSAQIQDHLDKAGNSAAGEVDTVGTLNGSVSLTGSVSYDTRPTGADAGGARMVSGTYTLLADLKRVVTRAGIAPDVKQSLEGPIDVKARIRVDAGDEIMVKPKTDTRARGGQTK